MANIFEVNDPRGYPIICTEEKWNNHILRRHSELRGKEADVIQALQQPAYITEDANGKDKNIYYRFRSSGARPLYLKVVVRFSNNKGIVITAFLADSGKTGERLIWMKSSA